MTKDVAIRLWPFALTIIVALGLQPFSGTMQYPSQWWLGVGLVGVAVLAILVTPWRRMPRWVELVPSLILFVAVALLRQSAGGFSSGFALLVLLPMVWFGLFGNRWQLSVIIVGAAVTLVTPLVLVGGPMYPAASVRSSIVIVAIGWLVGVATQRLRAEIKASNSRLLRQEHDLSGSLEVMVDPVGRYRVVKDTAGRVVDLECVYLNKAGRESLGEDVVGSRLSDRLAAEGRSAYLAKWLSALTSKEPVRYELTAETTQRSGMFEVQIVGVHDGVVTSWRNVTRERRAEAELRQTAEQWHSVADVASDAVLTLDTEGNVLYVSPSIAELLGFTEEQALGQNVLRAVHRSNHADVQDAIWLAATLEGRHTVEFRIFDIREPSRMAWLEARLYGAETSSGREISVVLRDVSKVHRERLALGHQATHDGLTGVLNRRGCEQTLGERLQLGEQMFVIYVDLDRFKPINDTYGHAAGDEVLIEVARRLVSDLRQGDCVARIGGDEFVLFGRAPQGGRGVAVVLQRLETTLRQPIRLHDNTEVSVGASFGSVLASADSNVTELLEAADREMYRAKRADPFLIDPFLTDPFPTGSDSGSGPAGRTA